MDAAPITHAALLQAALDGATVITPNRRLSRWIERQVDDAQRQRGLIAWERADILPYASWVEREWRELAKSADTVPLALLTPPAAEQLWESIIAASLDRDAAQGNASLMNPADAARDAMGAWRIAHAWHLFPALDTLSLSMDAALFHQWSRQFRAACARHHGLDPAALPDALARALAHAPAGSAQRRHLLVAGFDLITPQQHHLFGAWQDAGAVVELRTPVSDGSGATPVRHVFASEPEEWRACAAWVRTRCDADPGARIAVVSPGLARIKPGLSRALAESMSPARRLCPEATPLDPALVNVSLGSPLGSEPLVHDAMRMLSLALLPDQDVAYVTLGALMRSPHVGDGVLEASPRAALEVVMCETAPLELSFMAWRDLSLRAAQRARDAACCPRWHECLKQVAALASMASRRMTLAAWGPQFVGALDAWGFPGDRALDSRHYQVLAAFRDALASLPQAQAVRERIGAADALKVLRRLVNDALFQPESVAGAPVEVLGALESTGQPFDAIWVLGLDEDSWPLSTRPNPFLPAHLQRAAGVPEASPEASLALDARVTAAWLRAAPVVVFSHAQHALDADDLGNPRDASGLIRDVPECAFALPLLPPLSHRLQAGNPLETVADVDPAPLPHGTRVRLGATPLRDQAACAFRAFARHRLGASTLSTARLRPDSQQRGVLLHRVLHLLWQQLGDLATLRQTDEPVLQETIDRVIDQALNETRNAAPWPAQSRLRGLEAARLRRIVREWLEHERTREAFRVEATETAREVEIAGVRLSVRIDRIDQLPDGTRALIDYKTGAAARASWLGPRPDEPQLPLYFATAEEPITALAFGRVRRGMDMGFTGYGIVEGIVPGVTPVESDTRRRQHGYASWDALSAEWEASTAALASDLATRGPRLNPKRGAQTCAACDLQGLCRIGGGAVADATDSFDIEADDDPAAG